MRTVRARDRAAPVTDDLAPLLLDAVAHALTVYDGLGLRIGHVDIVLDDSHGAEQMGAGRETGAPVPLPAARATMFGPNECILLVPLAGFTPQKADAPELRYMAAHLVVHCIQAWRWPTAHTDALATDAWWVEGTADALASAAEPLDRVTAASIAAFDRESLRIALTSFTYEASPFFMWLWRADSGRFDALLRCAATDAANQTGCLLSEVGPDGLNGFARAYLDEKIATLRGDAVPLAPQAGHVADGLSGHALLNADAPMAALWRGQLALGPGRWTISADRPLPVSGVLGAQGWQPLGETIDSPCGGREVLVYAMPTAAAAQRFAISALRTADAACSGR